MGASRILAVCGGLLAAGWLALGWAGAEQKPVPTPREIPMKDVCFAHGFHAEEIGIECDECHHETNAPQLVMPHPEYFKDFWIKCGICHHENTVPTSAQACSSCHHATPYHIADETQSPKVVIHMSCWRCHEVGTGPEAAQSCATCHRGTETKAAGGTDPCATANR